MTNPADHLREEDKEFLDRKGWTYDVHVAQAGAGQELQIVVSGYTLPDKYKPSKVEVLVRQLPGYPETGMDMFWTRPDVTLAADGRKPQAADQIETYAGLPWQRWSRHLNGWRPQTDNLETFFASIQRELNK